MQRTLALIGIVSLGLVVVGALGAGYLIYEGAMLDKSSKAYVDRVVPSLLSSWSAEILANEQSSGFRQDMNLEELRAGLHKAAVLGTLKRYIGSEGEAKISISPERGRTITANYRADAELQHGQIVMQIGLVQESGQWRISGFTVRSN